MTPAAKIDPCQQLFSKMFGGYAPTPPPDGYIGGMVYIRGGVYIKGTVSSS
jgi:hypothetical protein